MEDYIGIEEITVSHRHLTFQLRFSHREIHRNPFDLCNAFDGLPPPPCRSAPLRVRRLFLEKAAAAPRESCHLPAPHASTVALTHVALLVGFNALLVAETENLLCAGGRTCWRSDSFIFV